MNCKPFVCVQVCPWKWLPGGIPQAPILSKENGKTLSDAVIRSGGQAHISPGRLESSSPHDPHVSWCTGLLSNHLHGLWPWRNHKVLAGVRDIVSLKGSKTVKHHCNMFLEWHCS